MRIVYISRSIIPSRTANSIHVMKMCQALAENRHDVTLLAPNLKYLYEDKVDDVYNFYGVKKNFKIKKLWHPNSKIGAFIYTISIFLYLLVNKKFNLVYGRFLHGCYISSLFKNKIIFEIHTPIYNLKGHRLVVFKKLIKNKCFKKLVVISSSLKEMYLESGYLNNQKIQVAHDGADEVTDFKTEIDLLGDKKNLKIGYVGHLYKGRGIEMIFECAKKIKDMSFHIVGGLEEDIKYWKNYSKSMKISNIYFYGFISPKFVGNYQNSFDIVLAPYSDKVSIFGNSGDSSKFMSPLKIFEYMSYKKAIISSDLPVLREVLNSKNSILVESENIENWVNAINRLRNQEIRDSIAENALRDFKNFSWKCRAFQIID